MLDTCESSAVFNFLGLCVCVYCECLKMSSNVMILVLESEVRKEEVMMAGANRVKNKPFFRREVTVRLNVRPSGLSSLSAYCYLGTCPCKGLVSIFEILPRYEPESIGISGYPNNVASKSAPWTTKMLIIFQLLDHTTTVTWVFSGIYIFINKYCLRHFSLVRCCRAPAYYY